jgi:predicted GNAT family acetyltransferase
LSFQDALVGYGRRMREIAVADNPEQGRYEARVDGELAGSLYYREREGGLILVHTEVEPEFEGQGVGGRLVAGTLDDIRARGLSAVAWCPFVRGYLERHPEYADLVAAGADR